MVFTVRCFKCGAQDVKLILGGRQILHARCQSCQANLLAEILAFEQSLQSPPPQPQQAAPEPTPADDAPTDASAPAPKPAKPRRAPGRDAQPTREVKAVSSEPSKPQGKDSGEITKEIPVSELESATKA